jgi:ELWxxDGT repeat protein
MSARILLLLILLPALSLSSPAAADPSLLRDLYPGTESFPFSAGLGEFNQESGGVLYFPAKDPAHGLELWRSDGTPEGTYRVTDVCPGPCDAQVAEMMPLDGAIYFVADDGVSGSELWASDGTPGNARRVRDLCPGPCGSRPASFQALNGRLLFEASIGTDRGLWSTNGSRRGTVLLRRLCTAGDNFQCTYGGLHRVGGSVLFQMNDTRLGIWRSDGTPEGTGPFTGTTSGGPPIDFAEIVPVDGNAAFLWAADALWWTDGTSPGTRRLRTAAELGLPAGGDLAFTVRSAVWHGMLISILPTHPATTLLRSDGTPEGTILLGQLPTNANLIAFAPLPDALLVVLQSPDVIWRTAGTPETTRQVTALAGPSYGIAPLQQQAVFCVFQTPNTGVLWVTDGMAGGTRSLDETPPTLGCGLSPVPLVNGRLLFLARGWEVWSTDGTTAGTALVHDFDEVPASSGPLSQIGLDGRLLFSARTAEDAAPLFVSDGTTGGTRQISERAGWAHGLVRVAQAGGGERVFFEARERTSPPAFRSLGLWSSDGTPGGTRVVKPSISSYLSPMPAGNALFFSAAREYSYTGQPDLELFRTDGSPERTGLVRNINRFSSDSGHHHICYGAPSTPGPGIDLNGRLVFTADDGLNGRELWSSDGKGAGTRLLRDIDPRRLPGPPPESCDDRQETGVGADPAGFVRFRDGVLFAASDGPAGRELWWTDGTAAGTRRVKDLRPGAQSSNPHDLVVFQGRVWFVASTQGAGEALWSTDGTAGGTKLVHLLTLGTFPSWAGELTVSGGRLFFRVYNETTGAELWTSGGATTSTRLVADLRPGPASSFPQSLTAAGGVAVFAADDGVHGLEPWQSDGTAAGTVPLGDINPGLDASGPGPFTAVTGRRLLTGADDGVHGRELWVVPLE